MVSERTTVFVNVKTYPRNKKGTKHFSGGTKVYKPAIVKRMLNFEKIWWNDSEDDYEKIRDYLENSKESNKYERTHLPAEIAVKIRVGVGLFPMQELNKS